MLLVTGGGLFVVTLVVITAVELVAGRSVSSMTGGSDSGETTIEQVGGNDSGDEDQPEPEGRPDRVSRSERETVRAVRRADRQCGTLADPGADSDRLGVPDRVDRAHADARGDDRCPDAWTSANVSD